MPSLGMQETNIYDTMSFPVGTVAVVAGRLVASETNTTRAVVPAGVGSLRVVGAADSSASAGGSLVVRRNQAVNLTASGAIGVGDRLVAGAAGVAVAAGAAADPRTLVGHALEPAVDAAKFAAMLY